MSWIIKTFRKYMVLHKKYASHPYRKYMLLVSCIFCVFSLSAQDIDVFRLKQKNAFTNETLVFSTIIEDVPPSQINLTVQSLPQNVSFVGSKKEKVFYNGVESSYVELHFVITKTGTYKISSVPVRIRYGYQYVGFEPIYVTDNPKTLTPRLLYSMLVEDENNTQEKIPIDGTSTGSKMQKVIQGERVELLVEAQYFASIRSFSWQANENSLVFNEVLLQTLPYHEEDFNPESVALARFEFVALETGTVLLPELLVQGKSWAATDVQIVNAAEAVLVSETLKKTRDSKSKGEGELSRVSDALVAGDDADGRLRVDDGLEVTLTTYDADLQNDFSQTFKRYGLSDEENKRIVAELEKDLKNKKALFHFFSLFSLVVAIFLLGMWVLFVIQKKQKQILLLLALGAIICYVVLGSFARQQWRVFEGTCFYTIPEEGAKISRIIEKPIGVRVVLETNDWAHIVYPILKNKKEAQYAWVRRSDIRN